MLQIELVYFLLLDSKNKNKSHFY